MIMYFGGVANHNHIVKFVCSFFITAVLFSSVQITVCSLMSPDGSWFEVLSSLMTEEENEETEKEEKEQKESSKEWISFYELMASSSLSQLDLHSNHLLNYKSICREVLSPPPDSEFTFLV